MNTITDSLLLEILDYDSISGVFTWAKKPNKNISIGSIAGSKTSDGYCRIKVLGAEIKAHRLAWLHHYKEWPSLEIDHINGDRFDNRISNLREVTGSENMQNLRSAMRTNKTGLLGVSSSFGKWRARIWVSGIAHSLGTFKTPEAAHDAYVCAKRDMHSTCTI